MNQEMTYYELLGISEDASSEEIKQAYRSNIKEWHPDLHPDKPDAAAKTQEINEAYDILSDPHKKAKYDEYLGFSRTCKVTPIRNQDDTVTEQATVEYDSGIDYGNMSFEDYVEMLQTNLIQHISMLLTKTSIHLTNKGIENIPKTRSGIRRLM